MRSRKTLILIGAIVIGAIAAFGLLNYVRGVEERAKPNPVDVYVISEPIRRGAAFNDVQASIRRKTIPAEFRPDTFVSDLRSLQGTVAVTNLAANQVLVNDMFVSAEVARTSFRDRIAGDNVAMALPIDGVRAVGGLLQPGDEVNIIVTIGSIATSDTGPEGVPPEEQLDPVASPYTMTARYLYQQVRILAIGSQVRPVAGEPVRDTAAAGAGGGSIIVEVPAEAAQVLAAIDPSSFYLTLIPETWTPRALPPMTGAQLEGLLPGELADLLTPYGPRGFVPVAEADGGEGG